MDWTDESLRRRMRRGWEGGGTETPCGNGSLLAKTKSVRERIPGLLIEYGIESIAEAGAGDMHWSQGIFDGYDYRPYDLVPRHEKVKQWDISQTALPTCDLVVCRLVLIHLDPPRVKRALELFRQSARFLLASQYEGHHRFNAASQFNRTNLLPQLGNPVERIPDIDEPGASLALWDFR